MVRPVVKAPKPLLGPRTAGVIALLLVPVAAAAAAGAVAVLVWGVTQDAAGVSVFLTGTTRLGLQHSLDLPAGTVLLGNLIDVDLRVPPLGLRLFVQGGTALLFLAVAMGSLAPARVLRTVRAGRPFARRNATWLAVVALAMAALEHAGLAGPDSPFLTTVSVPLFPLVLAALVLGIAEAFRRGAVIADDVDGLV